MLTRERPARVYKLQPKRGRVRPKKKLTPPQNKKLISFEVERLVTKDSNRI